MELELEEFISSTLEQIFQGVQTARSNLPKELGEVNPEVYQPGHAIKEGTIMDRSFQPIQTVDFDIAVTVSNSGGVKGKVKILIGFMGGGSEFEGKREKEYVNRIKFSVPISFSKAG